MAAAEIERRRQNARIEGEAPTAHESTIDDETGEVGMKVKGELGEPMTEHEAKIHVSAPPSSIASGPTDLRRSTPSRRRCAVAQTLPDMTYDD